MRFAYADPPYPGMGFRYPEKAEVDHVELVERLVNDYPEGWALSTGSVNLEYVLSMMPGRKVRIGAWVKTFCAFKPGVNPAYAWEPVLFYGGRALMRDEPTVVDWIACPITLRKGLVGAKPEAVCHWILDLLGFIASDELDDLYPGTGVMGRVVEARRAQLRLKP